MIWVRGGGGFNSTKETSICNQLNLIRVLPTLTSFDSEVFKGQGEGPQDGIWFPLICQDKKIMEKRQLKEEAQRKGQRKNLFLLLVRLLKPKEHSPKVIPTYFVWASWSPKFAHPSVSKKLRCSCCLILWCSQQQNEQIKIKTSLSPLPPPKKKKSTQKNKNECLKWPFQTKTTAIAINLSNHFPSWQMQSSPCR